MRRGRPPYKGLLTPREWQVLHLIEEGLTNEQIATRLGISFAGARYHVAEIISKLGVSGRMEAVAWAREQQQSTTGRRRWAGLALPALRLHLGSPAGIASVGAAVAGVVVVAALFALLFSAGAGDDKRSGGDAAFIDGQSAEDFLLSLPRLQQVPEGAVLYIRQEVYERHDPTSRVVLPSPQIPVERYVRESWAEAGPDDSSARAYGLVLDEAGNVIQVTVTDGGASRAWDAQSNVQLWAFETPETARLTGTIEDRIKPILETLAFPSTTVVSQDDTMLVIETVYDSAFFEQVLFEGMGLSDEEKSRRADSILQRDGGLQSSGPFAPFYGDLDVVALVTRSSINDLGLEIHRENTVQLADGSRVLVEEQRITHYEVVVAIPPEVIALGQ